MKSSILLAYFSVLPTDVDREEGPPDDTDALRLQVTRIPTTRETYPSTFAIRRKGILSAPSQYQATRQEGSCAERVNRRHMNRYGGSVGWLGRVRRFVDVDVVILGG